MKYITNLIIHVILIIPLISCNAIAGKVTDNKIAKKNYLTSYNKWKKLNIKNYYMKLNYGAFSPLQGLIEITVENGKIIKFIHENVDKTDTFKDNMPDITMENLFEKAKASYENKPEAVFIITALYDKDKGFVKMLSKTTNSKNAPTDMTYRYVIIDFKIL